MDYKNLLKAFIVSSISIFILSLMGGIIIGVMFTTTDVTENNIRLAANMQLIVALVSMGSGAFALIGFKELNKETAFVGAVGGAILNIAAGLILSPPTLAWEYTNFFGTTFQEELTNAVRLSYGLQVVVGVLIAGLSAYLAGRVKQPDFWDYQKKNPILLISGGLIGATILPMILGQAIYQDVVEVFIVYGSIGIVIGLFFALLPDASMTIVHAIGLAVLGAIAGGIGRSIASGSAAEISAIVGAGIGFVTALTYRRPTWMFLFLPFLAAGLSRGLADGIMADGSNSNPLLSILFSSGAALGMTAGLMIAFRQTTERVAVPTNPTSLALPQNSAQLVAGIQSIQERARDNIRHGAFEASKLRQTTNIRVKSGSLSKELDNKYEELGQLAYHLQQQRQANFPPLHTAWRTIWQLQHTLQTTEKQLEALKKADYQDETTAGRLSAGVSKAAFEAEKLRQSRALNGQIKTMQGEYQQKLSAAGQLLYQLNQTNQLPVRADLARCCEEIATLQATLSEYQAEMTTLQESRYVSERPPTTPEHSLSESTSALMPAGQPSPRFCIHCGTSLPEDAQFCLNCGTAVIVHQTAPQSPPAPQPIETPSPPITLPEGGFENPDLQRAVEAIQANNLKQANQLLVQIIKTNPRSKDTEDAWMWLAVVFSNNPDRKRQCFESVLKINPDNNDAKTKLKQLAMVQENNKQISIQQPEEKWPAWLLAEHQIIAKIEHASQPIHNTDIAIIDTKGNILRKFNRHSPSSTIRIFSTDGTLTGEVFPESNHPENPRRGDITLPNHNATIKIESSHIDISRSWRTIITIKDKGKVEGTIRKRLLQSKGRATSNVIIAMISFVIWPLLLLFWLTSKTGGLKGLHLSIWSNKHFPYWIETTELEHHNNRYWIWGNKADVDLSKVDPFFIDVLTAHMVWVYYFKP